VLLVFDSRIISKTRFKTNATNIFTTKERKQIDYHSFLKQQKQTINKQNSWAKTWNLFIFGLASKTFLQLIFFL
jgi:hypothetical protein